MISEYAAEHLRSVWIAIFLRKGAIGKHTNSFSAIEHQDRAMIQSSVLFENDELPVLVSVPRTGTWTMLTTKHLIMHNAENCKSLRLENIYRAKMDLRKMETMGITKSHLANIQILSNEGNSYDLELEAGASCIGFLNVLMHIARLNRDRAKRVL